MKNLFSFIPFAAIVIAAVFGVLAAIDTKMAKKVAIRTAAFIVAVIAFSLLLTLHGVARAEKEGVVVEYTPDEYFIEAAGENEILIKVPYEDKWLSLYWDTIDESFKPAKIWVRIVDGEFCVEADYAEEEPESIWFPPILLLGAIAPIEKKFKRAQKMPPDFYLPCGLFDKNTYVVYFTEGKKCFIKAALPEALKYITRAESKNIAAFVCTYVEEYKQQAVVACNYCDFLGYWRNTTISDRIKEAHKLTVNVITNNVEPKLDINKVKVISGSEIKDKDDPFVQIIEVKYGDSDKIFTFRCRQAHTPGDYVCVFTKRTGEATKTYKNVKVVKYTVMKESEVKALAKSMGYPDISEVSHDYAVDTEEAWKEWGGKDPRNQSDLADDPELYAPSTEEIAQFEAMREAYSPGGYRDF